MTLQFEEIQVDVVFQLSQAQDLIVQGVDAMIANPVDTAGNQGITHSAQMAIGAAMAISHAVTG